MKTKLFSIVVLAMAFISCSQDEDVTYSCDETVDSWVKEHISDIHKMNRSQWKELNQNYSVPVYRAFTPEQKFRFWQEKFKEVKSLPWNEQELSHIEEAEAFLNSHEHLFAERRLADEEKDELELFYYKWAKEAQEKLGWKEDIAIAIMATGYSLRNTDGELDYGSDTASAALMTPRTEKADCNCKYNIGCGIAFSCDTRANVCEETDDGCGILLRSSCVGICDPF